MNLKILSAATAVASGISYFVLGVGQWVLLALLVLTLATRFNARTENYGKFVEILFVFYLISYGIYSFGIYYPYSLIFVLTVMVVVIFYEGPEWQALFFGIGNTAAYFKKSIAFAFVCLGIFAAIIYVRYPSFQNPVPVAWPLDALVLVGIGFAFYRAAVEEVIFRSFVFERADSAVGGLAAVATQGVVYGLMHYRVGVPGGLEGLFLGSLFGIGSGYLVYKSQSILLSLMVQFIVTFGIFVELTFLGRM